MQFNRHLRFKAWVKDEVKDAFRKALDREMVHAWVKAVQKVLNHPPAFLAVICLFVGVGLAIIPHPKEDFQGYLIRTFVQLLGIL